MKLIHTADWHIGKQLNGTSMLEDQRQLFNQWIDEIKTYTPDAVLISGDVYDIARPGRDSIALVEELLDRMADEWSWPVIIINGNHDSGTLVGYGSKFFAKNNIHLIGTPTREVTKISVGTADIYPLAFDYYQLFRKLYDDPSITDNVEATARQVSEIKKQWDPQRQNILMYHGSVSDSQAGEDLDIADANHALSVGTVEFVPTSIFEGFDYVALGHIHGEQQVGHSSCYYSGAPLSYSKNEAKQSPTKYYLEVDIEDKALSVTKHAFEPVHPMRVMEDTFDNLLKAPASNDYIYFNVTDETLQAQGMLRLKKRFPNALGMEYATESQWSESFDAEQIEQSEAISDPLSLMQSFYQKMTDGEALTDQQLSVLQEIMAAIEEEAD